MNDAIHNAIGVDDASNGYNVQSTELNIAKSKGFWVLHLLYKSGRFCQLGFSNHSRRWKDFQSKIRLAIKIERTQHCMMWHA